MATIKEQRLVDSNKRALLKYVILGSGSQNTNEVLVNVSTLAYALNANGYIMKTNTHPKSVYRTAVKRAFGNITGNGALKLQWDGDSNTEIFTAGAGSFDYDFQSMGDGAVMWNNEANTDGTILITTSSMSNGDFATIFLELKKDSRDYDAGQTADPYAFNRVT
jgi:hypothetical protein